MLIVPPRSNGEPESRYTASVLDALAGSFSCRSLRIADDAKNLSNPCAKNRSTTVRSKNVRIGIVSVVSASLRKDRGEGSATANRQVTKYRFQRGRSIPRLSPENEARALHSDPSSSNRGSADDSVPLERISTMQSRQPQSTLAAQVSGINRSD